MSSKKFDKYDRKRVISEVEKHYGVRLSKVGRREKHLRDETGRSYWVLGGHGDWHGIPSQMMIMEEERQTNGVLVIAERYLDKMLIFSGDLRPLIENQMSLSHTKAGEYQFNIRVRGDSLIIIQVPACVLKLIATVTYTEEDKGSDKGRDQMGRLLDKYAPEKKKEFLDILYNKKNNLT